MVQDTVLWKAVVNTWIYRLRILPQIALHCSETVSLKVTFFWVVTRLVIWQKFIDVSEVFAASIIRAMITRAL
jgi:hypothetical protein